MKANEAPKSKFVYPDKLYARCKDNKTLDMSYAPQDMEAVEYVRLDTIEVKEVKEEPVSNDLEDAAIEYCGGHKGSDARVRAAFVVGANWKKQRMMKDAVECNVGWCDGLLLDYTQQQQDKALDKIGAKIGDKVKLVIIKDE